MTMKGREDKKAYKREDYQGLKVIYRIFILMPPGV